MNTTILSGALVLGAALISTLSATPVQAADAKMHPGQLCDPATNYDDVAPYWGRLRNVSGSTINFECPVIREIMAGQIDTGWAWVINQNYNSSLSCTLGLLSPTSGGTNSVSGYFSSRSTSVVSSAPQKLSAFGTLYAITDGYAAMICSVPGTYYGQASGVVSYRTDES